MTELNPSKLTELLSASGPFALMALLVLGIAYTFKELRQAKGATRQTFAKILIFEAVFGVFLSLFTMFVWYRTNVATASIITGTIEGLTDELVFSKELFLRPDVVNSYEWKLITPEKHKDGEQVDVIVTR